MHNVHVLLIDADRHEVLTLRESNRKKNDFSLLSKIYISVDKYIYYYIYIIYILLIFIYIINFLFAKRNFLNIFYGS